MYIMRVNANEALRKLVDEYPELRGQHIEIKIKQPAAEGGRYDPLTSGDEVLIQAEMEGPAGRFIPFIRALSGRLTQLPTCPMSVSITILW